MRYVLACLPALLVAGCGDGVVQLPMSPLHPVTGTVVRGGQPVAGGVVQFVPDPSQPEFLINSEVGPDGKFTLSTVRTTDAKGERNPGAPEGSYRVTYMPPVADQTKGNLEPIAVPKPVTVAASSNDLQIDLAAKR